MVREGEGADVPRVIVHEGRQVQPLVLAEQKREDVALPKLVRLGPLETTWRMLARAGGGALFDQPRLVQDVAHLSFRYAQRFEARQEVADPPRAVFRMLLAQLDDRLLLHPPACRRRFRRWTRHARHQRLHPAERVELHPVRERRRGQSEGARHVRARRPSFHYLLNRPDLELHRIRPTGASQHDGAATSCSIPSLHHRLLPFLETEIRGEGAKCFRRRSNAHQLARRTDVPVENWTTEC